MRQKRASDGALSTGEICFYTYDLIEGSWFFKEAPRNALAIKKVLRSLPKNIKNDQIARQYEGLTTDTFLAQKTHVIAPNSVVRHMLELISQERSVEVVIAVLNKLSRVEDIAHCELAGMWFGFGQLLESQNNSISATFYKQAEYLENQSDAAPQTERLALARIDKSDGKAIFLKKTLCEFQDEIASRQKQEEDKLLTSVVEKCWEVIDIEKEHLNFLELKATGLKKTAIKELDLSIPNKDRSKENRWYQYADFVREEVARGALLKKTETNLQVLDYALSLAVLTGRMSPRVFGLMLKYKGIIAERKQENICAAVFYEQALRLDPKIGVKRRLNALRKEIS